MNNSVEVDGLLNLGGANAIGDAVLNLAGQIDEIDLDGASDLTVTSSATVGDSDDSTVGLHPLHWHNGFSRGKQF